MKVQGESAAADRLVPMFESAGWHVQREAKSGPDRVDMVVSRAKLAYAVEIKAISEARSDRAIALLSQAILQSKAYADRAKLRPLAVICVGDAKKSLFEKVEEFARRYAPGVAIGVIAENGGQHFVGEGLEQLNAPARVQNNSLKPQRRLASDLFSDLNQWMLKVLLAPSIPEGLLSAPRDRVKNASELAAAARVSLMSASRFLSRLREEQFVDDDAGYLKLVRREDLFDRWRSVANRPAPEFGMCLLNPSDAEAQLKRVASRHHACWGMFAAADALKIGHVSGVVPHLYVEKLPEHPHRPWKELVPARQGERPDVILRRPNASKSVFRGAIEADGALVSDVLQIWIDASSHPSRGREQADFIRRKVIPKVFENAND